MGDNETCYIFFPRLLFMFFLFFAHLWWFGGWRFGVGALNRFFGGWSISVDGGLRLWFGAFWGFFGLGLSI